MAEDTEIAWHKSNQVRLIPKDGGAGLRSRAIDWSRLLRHRNAYEFFRNDYVSSQLQQPGLWRIYPEIASDAADASQNIGRHLN
jgi:hypothetical protein